MSLNAQGDHPGYQQDHHVTLPEHLATTATEKFTVYTAPRKCRVKEVHTWSSKAVTGADTNTTHINVLHGATEKANYDLTSGNNLVANAKKSLYAPATPLTLAAGERIDIELEKIGTGLLVPVQTIVVIVDFEP